MRGQHALSEHQQLHPVTQIDQLNAKMRERNWALGVARKAMKVVLERAMSTAVRKVMNFACGLRGNRR